jgi:hypothetical protein
LNSCTSPFTTITNGFLLIEWTSGASGTVRGKGSEMTIDGIFGVSCTWGTGTLLGTITGGTDPNLSIKQVGLVKTAGSFLCPSTLGWDAEYTITKPHALYIGA